VKVEFKDDETLIYGILLAYPQGLGD